MKGFRNYLLFAGSVGILSLTLALTNQGRTVHPPKADDTNNSDQQPFQTALCDTSSCVAAGQNSFKVPAGHRLVIEFVSGHCGSSESTVFLSTTVRGTTVAHNFVPVRTVNDSEGSFSQSTRIFADPGTNVLLSGNVPFPTCASVTLSGVLAQTQ